MRSVPMLLVAVGSLCATPLVAQDHIELGTTLGITVVSGGGETTTIAGAPGGGGAVGGAAFFGSRIAGRWMLETHLSFNLVSSGGSSLTQSYLALQGGYLLGAPTKGALYPFVSVGYVTVSIEAGDTVTTGAGEASEAVAGGGIGYRLPLEERFVLRFEGRYRRWFESKLTEGSLLMGVAVIL